MILQQEEIEEFQKGIEEGGVETTCTRSSFGIPAITKSTVSVAFQTP